MQAIRDTIKTVIKTLELRQAERPKDHPEALLKKAFSKKELGHIRWSYFKKGILSIKVDSSAWLYHLDLQKGALLMKLRKESSAIKDIRFSLGETK